MSDGELLIQLANQIKHSPGIVLAESSGNQDDDAAMHARIAVALKLRGRPVLAFKALMKRWRAQRIVRELF
jgi:hypothetical protein